MSRKITDHTEINEATIHDDDVIEIVDVSDSTDAASGTNKKSKWSTVVSKLKTYFDTIYSNFSGSYNDLTDKPTLGTAASADTGDFATSSQGGLADSAVQPGDLSSVATTGDYGDLSNTPDLSNLPSTDEKAALAGTDGAASGANKYVTDSDSRLSDDRNPSSHASSHVTGGGDKIRDASSSQDGLMTSAYADKLENISSNADVTSSVLNSASSKPSIVDADNIIIRDSADSNNIKNVLWSTLKTALNLLYAPKGAVTGSGLTMATGNLLGRYSASTGAIQEITIGSGLNLDGSGNLTAPGGGGADQIFYASSSEIIPRVTNGAGIYTEETSTNKINIDALTFDPATAEYAQYWMSWPSGWNTIKATLYWKANAASGSVVWNISARVFADGNSLDEATGTSQSITDAVSSANTVRRTSASSGITPSGSVNAGDLTVIQINRNPSDGSDDLAVDAELIGILIEKNS